MRTEDRSYVVLLAAVVSVVAVLLSGLGLAVYFAVTDDDADVATGLPAPSGGALSDEVREEIAAAPMLTTRPGDATGGAPALGALPTIEVPLVDQVGPEGIPTGYPRTPEGAVGQLGEILVSVLGAMDLGHAQRVQQAWFEDPAGSGASWPVLGLVQSFLARGGMASGLQPGASLTVLPAAGQIKGSDGDSWHVACVLLEITYTYRDLAQLGYGHCERMAWTGSRWVIGAGSHPVPAPSTWPGTERAVEAGWRQWRDG